MLRKRIRPVEPPADLSRSAVVTSGLSEAAMTTAMVVMAVDTAVVDGNAA